MHRKIVHHRMTKKAVSALQLAFEISGENPVYIRKTHQAVEGAYRYIESAGYHWDSEAGAWFYSRAQERARATLPFTITATPDDFESVLYVVTEALKAAHYSVHVTGEIASPYSSLAKTVLMVIEP